MPIFEYRCQRCGRQFEELQLSRDDAAVRCPSCGSSRAERLLSSFAVHAEAAASPGAEPGPCGACGAPQRGMCGADGGEW